MGMVNIMAKQLTELSYSEVRKDLPKVWEALPECYRDDTCLSFFLDVNGNVCADHDSGETFVFDEESETWVQYDGQV